MKKTNVFVLTIITALLFSACGAPPENKPATNANTAKPVAAAPTADALLTLEKQANEAYIKGDGKFFDGFLSDKFSMAGMKGKHMDKASTVKMIGGVKCDIKTWNLTEPQMSRIDNDTYAMSYKATWDGSCTFNGKTEKVPSPMRAASVFVRNGDKWLGAWHGETMIVEPKGDAKKDEAKKDEAKKDTAKLDAHKADVATAADEVKKEEVKKEAPKKDEVKKEEPKKEEAKKEEAKKDDKEVAAEEPKADANTDALTKLHQSGWEAWRDKDAAKLTALTSSNLAFVDAGGKWYGAKDDVIKQWTSMDCKDVKNVKVTDGFATALSPTVEIFTHKGTADGTCMGQKNGPLDAMAVYLKEGNDWKLVFLFESPAM